MIKPHVLTCNFIKKGLLIISFILKQFKPLNVICDGNFELLCFLSLDCIGSMQSTLGFSRKQFKWKHDFKNHLD